MTVQTKSSFTHKQKNNTLGKNGIFASVKKRRKILKLFFSQKKTVDLLIFFKEFSSPPLFFIYKGL